MQADTLSKPADAANRGSALDWTQRLVSYDTTSRHSNLGLIEAVRDHFLAKGLRPHLSYNPQGDKANLFVTVPAANGSTDGGIVLSGHTDVVPVDGQKLDHRSVQAGDPRRPPVRPRHLRHERLLSAPAWRCCPPSCRPGCVSRCIYALSFDEEIGCMGAPYLLAELRDRGVRPAGCIVGEPPACA
ncbi:hypothetical protein ACU4GD_27510 [Cupriavidus basilensis]